VLNFYLSKSHFLGYSIKNKLIYTGGSMKKLLMTILGVGFVAAATDVSAHMVERSDNGAYPSHVIMHSREPVRIAQRALLGSRNGIKAVLAAAEHEGFGHTSGGYTEALLDQLMEGSFVGLHDNADGLSRDTLDVDTDTGAITFMFDPREVRDGAKIGKFTVTYTPVFSGGATGEVDTTGESIIGWTCTTTVSTETHLGRGYVKHATGEIDPITDGLGWPFDGCTVQSHTVPAVDNG
jgi:hypothetical protein